MGYVFAVLAGYLLGCSNMALYICKAKKLDIRNAGSANLGAANSTIVLGWKWGHKGSTRGGFLSAVEQTGRSSLFK